MKIVSWNCHFWEEWKKTEKRIEWKKNIVNYIDTLEYDFLMLQEINPEYLFDYDLEKQKETNGYLTLSSKTQNRRKLFLKDNSVIHYDELDLDEIGATSKKEIVPWGNAIITRNSSGRGYITNGKKYAGRNALQCYDFDLQNGRKISLINFYGKKEPNSSRYPILEYGIEDIENFVKNKQDDHLTILAGDFNCDPVKLPEYKKLFFDKLIELGFINCSESKDFENTMVSGARPWPNDKIFVNRHYHKFVECSLRNDTSLELSDHKPIECIIDENAI
jgi:endonuclease/exonuclease/phosphatase family metal-dependent hydrolase